MVELVTGLNALTKLFTKDHDNLQPFYALQAGTQPECQKKRKRPKKKFKTADGDGIGGETEMYVEI